MIPYDEMPDDNLELVKLEVEFPSLPDDTIRSCPVPISQILDYLVLETAADNVDDSQLMFLRTAQVAETRYWIWRFIESDGTKCYVTVSEEGDGSTCVGYGDDYGGWTPEQYMLGDYHNVF